MTITYLKIKPHLYCLLLWSMAVLNFGCAQSSNRDDVLLKNTIKIIQDNNIDLLTASFSSLSEQTQDSSKFIPLFGKLHYILTEYSIPVWNTNLPSVKMHSDSGKVHVIHNYEYRLSTKIYELGDSIILVHLGVVENKLYSIGYKVLTPRIIMLEPDPTKHEEKFKLKTEDVVEFNLVYKPGNSKKNDKDHIKYYQVYGGADKLERCKLAPFFERLFNLINEAKFDSTDYKLMISHTRGESEEFYLRVKFKNGPYAKFGDFEIVTCLSNEIGVMEELMGYIILIHSKTTRYFIKKEDNRELTLLIEEMAYTDYGKCKE